MATLYKLLSLALTASGTIIILALGNSPAGGQTASSNLSATVSPEEMQQVYETDKTPY
jgi:hypothetical protein